MNTVDKTIEQYLEIRSQERKKRRERNKRKAICRNCKKEYLSFHGRQKFCTLKCQFAFRDKRYHETKTVSPFTVKTCKHCQKEFSTNREIQAYCSVECRTNKHSSNSKKAYAIGRAILKEQN